MCNCYFHECEKCAKEVPVHIGDFRYPTDDLKVWCGEHLPRLKATIFTLIEDEELWPGEKHTEYPMGWKCAIRLRGGKIEPDSNDVSPNLAASYEITVLD